MPNNLQSRLLAVLIASFGWQGASARDWHVNPESGTAAGDGSPAAPFVSAQKAVNSSAPGDVIHLHPPGAVYRQSITLRGRKDLTIEGNGVTLDGSDPLPVEGWENPAGDLKRLRLRRTVWDRHLLTFDDRTEHMGRTQSSSSPAFPKPEALQPGQFCFVNDSADEKAGWLYVRGDAAKLEWSVRPNGLATSGTNSNVVVRNLNARRFLNDGFNIHGHSTGLRFENIRGYDCFDEGFSAHDTCEAEVRGGEFWGNENGIADVNFCVTRYWACVFRGNMNVDVLLIGKTHSLTDCEIRNTTTAAALTAGPRGKEAPPFELKLTRVKVAGRDKERPARIRVNGGALILRDCELIDAEFNPEGARLDQQGVTVNGAPFLP